LTLDTRHIAAIATGASLPLMVFGVAVMQGGLIIALTAALFSVGRFKNYGNQAARSLFTGMVAFVLLAWLPSIATSIEPLRSLETWGRIPLLILASTILWMLLRDDERLYFLSIRSLLCSAAGVSLFAVFLINGGTNVLYDIFHTKGVFNLIRPFKAYSNVAMCLVPLLLFAGYSLKGRWWSAALAIVALNLLIIAQTRTGAALAGLITASAFIGLLKAYRHPKFRFAYLLTFLMAIPAAWVWLSNKVNPETPSPNIVPNWLVDGHRQYIWRFAYEKIWESPWFGHGINAIDRIPGAKDHPPGIDHPYIPSHPHNIYLEVGAETGLIGLSALLIVIGIFVVVWTRQYFDATTKDVNESNRYLAMLAVWVAFWTSSTLNFSLWSAWWELTLFVSMALLLAGPRFGSNPLGDQENPLKGH